MRPRRSRPGLEGGVAGNSGGTGGSSLPGGGPAALGVGDTGLGVIAAEDISVVGLACDDDTDLHYSGNFACAI